MTDRQTDRQTDTKITVATCCYDKDYQLVMQESWLRSIFDRFNFDFYEKLLVVNTEATEEIRELAANLITLGVVDNVVFCKDLSKAITSSFDISSCIYEQKFKILPILKTQTLVTTLRYVYNFFFSQKGNCIKRTLFTKSFNCEGYLLGPLAALLNARGDYLLYFTEDCAMESDESDSEWIINGIRLMDAHNKYIAVRPGDSDLDDKWIDGLVQIENFREAYTFTDRMFLVNVSRMKSIDYNCRNLGNYPAYGGAGFEARVYNYMVCNDLRMLISENERYIHESEYYTSI